MTLSGTVNGLYRNSRYSFQISAANFRGCVIHPDADAVPIVFCIGITVALHTGNASLLTQK